MTDQHQAVKLLWKFLSVNTVDWLIWSTTLQNAFPVSGQLYTTHLLSLEALLTVIDSTEAHCQAKVMNRAAEQEHSETLTAEGEASVDSTTDAVTGLMMISELIFSSHRVFDQLLLSFC